VKGPFFQLVVLFVIGLDDRDDEHKGEDGQEPHVDGRLRRVVTVKGCRTVFIVPRHLSLSPVWWASGTFPTTSPFLVLYHGSNVGGKDDGALRLISKE